MPGRPFVVDYRGEHRFAVPRDQVWAKIADVGRFERRWRWLGEFRVEGDGLASGSVLHGRIDPPLPFKMRLTVAINDCVNGERVDATVSGDLVGPACITLDDLSDGAETMVTASWVVEMTQRSMRMAAPFAYPILRWAHDRVVDATVAAFRSDLQRG